MDKSNRLKPILMLVILFIGILVINKVLDYLILNIPINFTINNLIDIILASLIVVLILYFFIKNNIFTFKNLLAGRLKIGIFLGIISLLFNLWNSMYKSGTIVRDFLLANILKAVLIGLWSYIIMDLFYKKIEN